MADVRNWLSALHLEQYYSTLIDFGYTSLRACATLCDSDLQRLGIDLPGHRKRILAHLPSLEEEVEYGNIVLPKPTSPDVVIDADIPPPKAVCRPPKEPLSYLHMDRCSVNVSGSDQSELSEVIKAEIEKPYDISQRQDVPLPDASVSS